MILETHLNDGLKAHLSMLRLNGRIHFVVDVFDENAKVFLPDVKVFKPEEKEQAREYARQSVGIA